MKWSWRIGRFAGVDTYVHATFMLLVGWAAWAAYSGAGTALAVILGVGFLLAVFGSVLLHELGHALVARRYGIRTRKIILSPIGGLAQLEGMPSRPREELAVALAGPAVNFALAAGLWILGGLAGGPIAFGFLDSLMWANLTLGLFNLVPAFPMDGGRALRALLSERMGNASATEIAAFIGKTVAVAMAIVGAFVNWMLLAVAIFVWFAADQEVRATRLEALYERGIYPPPRRRGIVAWLSRRRRAWARRHHQPAPASAYRRPTWDLSGADWSMTSMPSVRVVVLTSSRY